MKTAPAAYSKLRFSTGKNIKIYQKKRKKFKPVDHQTFRLTADRLNIEWTPTESLSFKFKTTKRRRHPCHVNTALL
jgi:hypothetical protein